MIREEAILAPLTNFPPKKQLAFALLLFERMLPDLIHFSKDTSFDASCYLQAKDAAWKALRNGSVDQALNEACIRNAPDTENFSQGLTSYALNAALAMSDIAEFTVDGRADHIVNVLSLARDSVDLYLSSLKSPGVSSDEEDRRIAQHPLVQNEKSREEEDVKFLLELPDSFDENVTSILMARASAQSPLLPVRL